MADLDEPIELSPYDPSWPELFAEESMRLRAVLPTDARIEHIGSTAVVGMLAKPTIDIMVGVQGPRASAIGLERLNYEEMGEAGVPGRRYFRRRGRTNFNIAVVDLHGVHWKANLAFRDYLRNDPRAAAEYVEGKQTAIREGATMLLAYSSHKAETIAALLKRALS